MAENRRLQRGVVSIVAIIATIAVLRLESVLPSANAATKGLTPQDDNAYGNTYGEWSARWIQWFTSIPAATNPVFDTTGANCGQGQPAGPVWFLAGTFSNGKKITRACSVPAGKALFFPLINVLFGSGAFDCDPTNPGVACNLATLRQNASDSMDNVILTASVDGKSLSNLTDQRVQPPVIVVTWPEGNFAGVPPATYTPNVADGYWLMLEPLSVGVHTISFRGEITGGPFTGTINGPVTYVLTINP